MVFVSKFFMSKLPIEDARAARVAQKRGRRNAVCGAPVDIQVQPPVFMRLSCKVTEELTVLPGGVCVFVCNASEIAN